MSYFKHPNALIEEGAKIGEGTRIWAFTNIQAGAVIGSYCNICDGTFVERGVLIGDHVTIKHHVSVFNGVTIEDDVFVGSHTAFINDRYPRSHREDPWNFEKTLIKKGATLGSNAVILCGITIGEYALVGAGSVVTKNVPHYAIVSGNPASFKGFICQCGQKLYRIFPGIFVGVRKFQCRSGHQYLLKAGQFILPVRQKATKIVGF